MPSSPSSGPSLVPMSALPSRQICTSAAWTASSSQTEHLSRYRPPCFFAVELEAYLSRFVGSDAERSSREKLFFCVLVVVVRRWSLFSSHRFAVGASSVEYDLSEARDDCALEGQHAERCSPAQRRTRHNGTNGRYGGNGTHGHARWHATPEPDHGANNFTHKRTSRHHHRPARLGD